jgi:hypothetical protein
MPALPWFEAKPIASEREYSAMASRLPLARYRSVPGFMRDTLRIRRQLAAAPGLVGYGLKADLFAKTFWTFSVWEDRASIDTFAASEPHGQIIKRLRPKMTESQFSFFDLSGSSLPMSWAEMTASVR